MWESASRERYDGLLYNSLQIRSEGHVIFGDFGNPTILVVDDQKLITELMTAILRYNGFAVLTAATADDALALSVRHRDYILVIILDYSVVINRNQVAASLLAGSPAKLILMSGYCEEMVRSSGVQFDEFLQKPFTSADVLNIVRRTLGGHTPAVCAKQEFSA